MSTKDYAKYLKVFKPKEVLIAEGDTEADFFCLLQGTIDIWKGDIEDRDQMVKVGSLSEKGAYFGEMSFLLGEQRTASIIASDAVKVLKFPGEMLPQMMMKQPKLGYKLCTALADRLKGTTSKTEEVGRERNTLRGDATSQLFHAKEVFQKMFILLTAIQAQFQNPLLKSAIEWMARDKLLQGGKRARVEEHFLDELPPRLADLVKRSYTP